MDKNNLMHRTHTIVMTHEQLRVIQHAILTADMSCFNPQPEDDIDAEGCIMDNMLELCEETLNEPDSNMVHGWAV